jgi:multidrug efflux system membrane fusion protein
MFSLNWLRDLLRALFGCAVVVVLLTTLRADAADTEKHTASEPPVVQVARVVERDVTDFEVFNGRVEAAESVNVASRVTGYLTKVAFKDGAEVKKGDLLFEIDPRPYQAQVDQAEAEVRLAEARLNLAQAEFQRGQELIKSQAIAQSEFAKFQAAKDEAQAGVEAAKAKLAAERLTLSFCKIVAPIDGRIGRASVTPGNLVKQDETVLTTIVSLNPVCVSFDIDERTWLRLARAAAAGGAKGLSGAALPVFVQTTDEKGFPHEGTVTFISNEFNPSTGTIAARATLPNLRANDGVQAFVPGMFVRARIQIGPPHRALLVSDSAIRRTLGRSTVSVVGDDQVESRPVTIGQLQDDGLRVIERGLKADDRIVIGSGALKRDKIRPQLVPMPTKDSKTTPTTK